MVFANPQAVRTNVAMEVPKTGGKAFRMVADYRAANAQVELVPWPTPLVKVATSFFRWGASVLFAGCAARLVADDFNRREPRAFQS